MPGINAAIPKAIGIFMLASWFSCAALADTPDAGNAGISGKAERNEAMVKYLTGAYFKQMATTGACAQEGVRPNMFDDDVAVLRTAMPGEDVAEFDAYMKSGVLQQALAGVKTGKVDGHLEKMSEALRKYACGVYFGWGFGMQSDISVTWKTLTGNDLPVQPWQASGK